VKEKESKKKKKTNNVCLETYGGLIKPDKSSDPWVWVAAMGGCRSGKRKKNGYKKEGWRRGGEYTTQAGTEGEGEGR
jgi:hypothetical protein